MRDIRIESETESGRGWWFHARFEHACSASPRTHTPFQSPAQTPAPTPVPESDPDAPAQRSADVHLSWADYEYWCHGARAPADVVRALIRFLTQQDGFEIPPRFDAATARRWFPDLDHALLSPW